MNLQPTLLSLAPEPRNLPEGFVYEPNFLTEAEEQDLIAHAETLDWQPFEMHGVIAKRRVFYFGHNYGPSRRNIEPGGPIPEWLNPLRAKAAARFGLPEADIAAVLVNEYRPGAGIGWHRDAPGFDKVIGVSLGRPARFQLRPYVRPGVVRVKEKPLELAVEPRSVYRIAGHARWQWEHHIPASKELRYSITLRTLRNQGSIA
jgi:alkylated DNA repair dioxygenase AlkB